MEPLKKITGLIGAILLACVIFLCFINSTRIPKTLLNAAGTLNHCEVVAFDIGFRGTKLQTRARFYVTADRSVDDFRYYEIDQKGRQILRFEVPENDKEEAAICEHLNRYWGQKVSVTYSPVLFFDRMYRSARAWELTTANKKIILSKEDLIAATKIHRYSVFSKAPFQFGMVMILILGIVWFLKRKS